MCDEFYCDRLPLNATQFHTYVVEWTPTHIDFYVDDIRRRTVQRPIHYPMQFMLGIYELPGAQTDRHDYPRAFVVDYFRAYRPLHGY